MTHLLLLSLRKFQGMGTKMSYIFHIVNHSITFLSPSLWMATAWQHLSAEGGSSSKAMFLTQFLSSLSLSPPTS